MENWTDVVTNGMKQVKRVEPLEGAPPSSANLIMQEPWEAPEGGTSQEVFIPMPACVFMCSCEVMLQAGFGGGMLMWLRSLLPRRDTGL